MLKNLLEKLYFRYCAVKEEDDFDKDSEQLILQEMAKVENAENLMRFFLKRDRNRYFVAQDDKTRNLIKGQYLRTAYILSSMQTKKEVETSKLENKRYGV